MSASQRDAISSPAISHAEHSAPPTSATTSLFRRIRNASPFSSASSQKSIEKERSSQPVVSVFDTSIGAGDARNRQLDRRTVHELGSLAMDLTSVVWWSGNSPEKRSTAVSRMTASHPAGDELRWKSSMMHHGSMPIRLGA